MKGFESKDKTQTNVVPNVAKHTYRNVRLYRIILFAAI